MRRIGDVRHGMRATIAVLLWAAAMANAQESPYIYGIHDADPSPQEFLNRLTSQGVTGWVTATVAIGHNPADTSGSDFRFISNQGHTVICRLNNGYGTDGTIPVPAQYGNFATRCANFVAASQGCNIWIIGNETNLASEWPMVNGYRNYISPQDYANCFRQCYNAIKAVRPSAKVLCQALAPFAGPYGAGPNHAAQPLGWTTYMNQMLTAIAASGGIDGIAVHINSRGYTYADVHSTQKVNGQYFSFYVYQDWVNLGTPPALRSLPYYATECNGIYYWKGGHPECSSCANPSCCYQSNWMQWIYEEINAWNQSRAASGQGIYRCVNMYRWCAWCDDWNIDGSPQKAQILADIQSVAARRYRWDVIPPPVADFTATPTSGNAPLQVSFTDTSTGQITSRSWTFGDGGSSTAVNPTYTYAFPGTYTVSLTVTGPGGVNTKTRSNYITAGNAGLADIIIESRSGGQNYAWYAETGVWADFSGTSSAPGVTSGIGSRYASTYRSVAGLKIATFTPQIASPGRYRVYATWPASSLARSPILYRVTHADGTADLEINQTQNANTWFLLGEFRFSVGQGGSVRMSNERIDVSGSMFASAVRFLQVTAVPLYSKADFDRDGDVDQDDFGVFQRCLSGTGVVQNAPACIAARLDADEDVDAADLSLFISCISGSERPADTTCPP